MIELVIKIPEEVKHKVYAYGLSLCPSDKEQLINAIMNGVSLPKGHGDLKDMNDLCCKSRYGCKDNCEYIHTCNIYGAKTIIEADKESEDKR